MSQYIAKAVGESVVTAPCSERLGALFPLPCLFLLPSRVEENEAIAAIFVLEGDP